MVGTLAGIGDETASAVASAAVVLANLALRPLVHRLDIRLAARGLTPARVTVTLVSGETAAPRLRTDLLAALRTAGVVVDAVQSGAEPGGGTRLTVHAGGSGRAQAIEVALATLSAGPEVRSLGWVEERASPDS
jgi:hypothetical protein